MNRPACGGDRRPRPRARNQVREPRRRKTRGQAGARTQDTRAKKGPAAARTEWSGRGRDGGTICRNGTTELHARHGEHDMS